jgi:hypothetical protein
MKAVSQSSHGAVPFQRFFGILGYSIFCVVVVACLLEFSAFSFFRIRETLHGLDSHSSAPRGPAYDGQSWAKEFLEEAGPTGKPISQYVPFRIWGLVNRHGQYINVDTTEMGSVRRTINPVRKECAGRPTSKIWVLGESTVYGVGAPDWGTLPSYLSAAFNGPDKNCAEVSNLGVPSYVTNQEVILLTEKLKAGLRPDAVIFFDGWNDSTLGGFSPGDPTAHMNLERIKLGVENVSWNKLNFLLNDLYSVRVARSVLNRIKSSQPVRLSEEELGRRAKATVANYEANLRIIEALANVYGFKAHFFWQPCLSYGSKPTGPFERELVRIRGDEFSRAIRAVYEEAERRSAITGSFVFLGHLFDQVREPLFVDRANHLCPLGNEIVARAIAEKIKGSGVRGTGIPIHRDGMVAAR